MLITSTGFFKTLAFKPPEAPNVRWKNDLVIGDEVVYLSGQNYLVKAFIEGEQPAQYLLGDEASFNRDMRYSND